MEDVLPDNWEPVVKQRTRELYYNGLRNLRANKTMFVDCEDCPMLRTVIGEDRFSIWVFAVCRLQGNKCIKQYPLKVDNEEFK